MMSSSDPTTMPIFGGVTLPEDIVVWEILVRLPPKPLLRCRMVCRSWRRLTSTRDFLAAHHNHQPALPLVCGFNYATNFTGYLDMLPLSRGAAPELQPVSRTQTAAFNVVASCDGLLILSQYADDLFVCNPTTFQIAGLGFAGFVFVGFYPHLPTGEYRLLLYPKANRPVILPTPAGHGDDAYRDQITGPRDAFYVVSLGSHLPRCIGESAKVAGTPVLINGCLHWNPATYTGGAIMVFDTVAESFRAMGAPAAPKEAYMYLFEMNGTLGVYNVSSSWRSMDVWVLQDYASEAWAFRCRIELPLAQIRQQSGRFTFCELMVAAEEEGDVHVIIHCHRCLFHVDAEGKLLARFHRDGQDLRSGPRLFKQSLIRHDFFSKLE